jgi:mono/diheme cytochrome c family protein
MQASGLVAGSMRKIVAGSIVVVAGLVVAYVYVAGRGFSARAEPTAIERAIALQLRSLATPRDAKATKNPLPDSPDTLRAGLEHFADHCAICHGNDGSGKSVVGSGLYPKPPDLRADRTQKLSDGELFYIIENGVRLTGMPAFGGPGSNPNDTWPLVTFIRHLPNVTAEELRRIEELNPKSAEEWEQERAEQQFLEGGSTPRAPKGHTHH